MFLLSRNLPICRQHRLSGNSQKAYQSADCCAIWEFQIEPYLLSVDQYSRNSQRAWVIFRKQRGDKSSRGAAKLGVTKDRWASICSCVLAEPYHITIVMITSVGGMASEATTFYKLLASILSNKWDQPYHTTMSWARCHLKRSHCSTQQCNTY